MAAKNPRQRKAEAKAQPHAAADLIGALRFVMAGQKKAGPIYQTHCAITKGAIMAYDGLMTVGHRIADDLHACPNTAKLLEALTKCGQNISIAQLDANRIQVKSDKFKAFVPCVSFDEIPYSEPNPYGGPIDDKVKSAIKAASLLVSESSDVIHLAATLLQANTAVGTNGHALLEYWHGWDLPANVLLPKAAVHAVASCSKPLTGFGYNGNSATFYFGNDAFIKTQLFDGRYANYLPLLDVPTLPGPLPVDFFAALDKVSGFAEGTVYFDADGLRSHREREQGASFEMEGLPAGMGFDPDYLQMLKPFIQSAYFIPEKMQMFFFADKLARGLILGKRI